MKKLLILFAIIPIFGFSQIKEMEEVKRETIGNYYKGSTDLVTLERWSDNKIVVFYKNTDFKQISDYDSFSFLDVDNSLEMLYKTLIDGLNSNQDFEKSLELPDVILRLYFFKELGISNVQIRVQNKKVGSIIKTMTVLNEDAINKIFGKVDSINKTYSKDLYSKWMTFNSGFKHSVYSRFSRINNTNFIEFKIMIFGGLNGKEFSISNGKKVIFFDENNKAIELYHNEDRRTCYGCGATGLSGSAAPGIHVVYELKEDELKDISQNKIVKYLIQTDDEIIENELKPKKQEEFKKNLQTILD